ncbi:hypothetical protein [Marinobacter sp.]|uniref:hypothetical protein n=1 Tax=Marinobacter sp. TaxID=50741 RepID=UPI003A910547
MRLSLLSYILFPVCVSGLLLTSAHAAQPTPSALEAGLEQFAQAKTRWYSNGHSDITRKSKQQKLYEDAEAARASGDAERAGKILATMAEGYWSAVGYLNLSGDYARNDLNPSRALVALRVALAMADKDTDAGRKSALRSRILLRAGYLAYTNSEYEKAIGFLEKIPLDSHRTPQALYFHGLVLAEEGNYRAAMQSWHRAKKYPLAYPGVADAWLGMARGYDLAGYLGQAGEAYLTANATYEGERATLRMLASQIEQQGAYKALVLDARDQSYGTAARGSSSNAGFGSPKVEWFLADSRTLAQPRVAYLLSFMEQPIAQQAVGRVAELAAMASQLERNAHDLGIFIAAMQDQLKSKGVDREAAVQVDRLTTQNKRLQGRLSGLMDRLDTARLSSDQISQFRILKTTLSDAGQRLEKFQSRSALRSDNLNQLLADARRLRKQSLQYLDSVKALRAQAETSLDRLALDFVATQDQKMVLALDKTEQRIAYLYEYLALKELDSGELER